MKKIKLPKSIRKFIRKEKVRISRDFLDEKEKKEQIKKLYEKILKQYENKRNLPVSS